MRQISKRMVNAIQNSQNFKLSNTEVKVNKDKTFVYLHGNCISVIDSEEVFISTCGWRSITTKERLNAILAAFKLPGIYQKKGVWQFTDGTLFDSQTKIFYL